MMIKTKKDMRSAMSTMSNPILTFSSDPFYPLASLYAFVVDGSNRMNNFEMQGVRLSNKVFNHWDKKTAKAGMKAYNEREAKYEKKIKRWFKELCAELQLIESNVQYK